MDKPIVFLCLCLFAWWSGAAESEAANDIDGQEVVIPKALLDQVAAGHAESAYFIALAFDKGSMELEKDSEKAKEWFLKAAEMGHVHGMFDTARLLFNEKSYSAAKDWFDKASKAGHGEAFYRAALYHIYAIDGVPFDCDKAYELMSQAQLRDVKPAFNDHAWMLSTLPQNECRNGQKAWKIFADLQGLYGAMEPIPWAYLDTKAAVLAEIADYNEAIEIQSWIVEDFCDVEFSKDEGTFKHSVNEMTEKYSEQEDALCYGSIKRLQSYINRQPWREEPQFN